MCGLSINNQLTSRTWGAEGEESMILQACTYVVPNPDTLIFVVNFSSINLKSQKN